MRVYGPLKSGDLDKARYFLSRIVGRDTQNLDEERVAKAAVETVAENTSDGIVAPLFYLVIGGAPLGFLYKAVNTMDSMIGYKNERYLYFGRAAAKLDDAVNFIPAILSAWLMIAASYLLGLDGKNAQAAFIKEITKIIPALTAPGPNQSAPGRLACSLREMRFILESWYKSQPLEIRAVR